MSNKKTTQLVSSLLFVFGILFCAPFIQAQNPQGIKVSPTKTATVNFKENEKSAANQIPDSLQRKKPANEREISQEPPLPRGAKIIKHKPPQTEKKDTPNIEIRKKDKGGREEIEPFFPALEDNNTTIPPDIGAAAGPNHLMVALNSQVRIQNKAGGILSTTSLNAFFSPLGGSPNMFDPKVLYDPFAQRWIITAPANALAANSSIMVGVSNNNDPTGAWQLFQFDVDATNANWFDYPSIGFNRNWIVVTGNMFSMGGSFQGTQVYAFDKAALYGGTATPTLFNRPSSEGSTICPAVTLDNAQNIEYLVSGYNSFSGVLRLYTITGTPGSPIYTATSLFPSAVSNWAFSPPGFNDFAPQATVSNLINNGDHRMQNAVFRNGSLWCAHTIFLPQSGPTHSAIQWWQIDPSTGTVMQNSRIEDITAANFFAFPSIAVNAYNDVYIGYSSFSSSQFASCNYSFRLHTDPLNTMQPSVQYKAGLASYFKTFGGPKNRWGDYSSTCIDPDDFSMWTIQEYAEMPVGTGVNASRWGTYWNKIVPPVAELYAQDRSDDTGAEPNPSTAPMWESPDIWIRKAADGGLAHENAEYRISAPNYVYVRIHNRGGAPSAGTEQVTLYWAKAGSYLDWLDPWNGGIYFDPGPNTMLMGGIIGTPQTIPSIPAGSSAILPPFAWNPTDPALYAVFGAEQNHYCLLARITTNTASPFGMTFPETSALYSNVQNNNNIVWKNISVFDMVPGNLSPATAVVGNLSKAPMNAAFKFELLNQNGDLGLFDKGTLKISPVGKMKDIFKQSHLTGEGVKQNEDGSLTVSQQSAVINGILLNPNDFGAIKIAFMPNQKNDKVDGFAIRFTQLADVSGANQVIGGQTFVYGQVTGFATQPDKESEHCWWWYLLGAALLCLIIWWWRRKK